VVANGNDNDDENEYFMPFSWSDANADA